MITTARAILILVAIVLVALCIWGPIYLMKQAEAYYLKFNAIKDRAERASSKEELVECFESLKEISQTSFHREMYSSQRELAGYIRGKYNALK